MFSDQLENTALVVAHPDDEILWFSSIVRDVGAGFVCFGDTLDNPSIGAGRHNLARSFPLKQFTFLEVPESGVFNLDNWICPTVTEFGMQVPVNTESHQRYINNYSRLYQTLSEKLAGYATVITHNPWGEYGHEEHVQVHRVVNRICKEQGKTLLYTNYCSDRSILLMRKCIRGFCGDIISLPTNIELASQLESLYRQHNIWTWPFDGYPYFPQESFVVDAPRTTQRLPGSRLPINYIEVDGINSDKNRLVNRIKRKVNRLMSNGGSR